MNTDNFNTLFEKAKGFYAAGYDDIYIANQFAEQNVNDDVIDAVLKKIKEIRKTETKTIGKKQILYGISFILFGLGITWLTYNLDIGVAYIMWGLPIVGVFYTIKGISNIAGL